MKVLAPIMRSIDILLSPQLRKQEPRELMRLRFLVFTLLVQIPCGFIPTLAHDNLGERSPVLQLQGPACLLVAAVLIGMLRLRREQGSISIAAIVWLHMLYGLNIVAWPSVLALAYLWSTCLIVSSCLLFGIRGAMYSSIAITTMTVSNVIYHFQRNAPWVLQSFDSYGLQVSLSLAASMIITAIVTAIFEFMRDSTDRQQSRQRLMAARHAHTGAVGELVGHVAHEVNNPLAILQGSAARLRRQLEQNSWDHSAKKLLAHMQRSHDRIIKVQQSLAVFSSGDQYEPFVDFDVRSIAKDVQLAMKPQAHAQQVLLDFRIDSVKKPLRCQPHQLTYVLCSLIQNAMDACRDSKNPEILVTIQEFEDMFRFSVRDNGKGIQPSATERIFEPFFTTKTGGSVQGLSLSVCRGIVSKHEGVIYFESEPGSTEFVCEIPRRPGSSIRLQKGA